MAEAASSKMPSFTLGELKSEIARAPWDKSCWVRAPANNKHLKVFEMSQERLENSQVTGISNKAALGDVLTHTTMG